MLLTARSLLLALILACAGVVLSQMPAQACSCAASSVEQQVNRADLVFRGVVVETSSGTAGRQDLKVLTYQVQADTLFKGDLARPAVKVSTPRGGGTCGLGTLPADRPYLFFVAEDGRDLTSDICSGTARAGDPLTGKVQNLLGTGTDLTPREEPEPAAVEFTEVVGSEPETLTRLAAPGIALVLLGLLGLVVVRRATARD